ncbi:MAG TPA: 2-C-methyl-D-erythritol 2,4-cyclodiphosphate synthase [Bacteroidia bacterium]
MKIKVGFGFDVHQLVEGRELWLGGIKIEHSKGALGHSDADVLIHAICDALLGAANMRDIGFHFSNTDAKYKNIDSKILLKETVALLESKNYRVGNVDATLAMEKPKINPHIPAMQAVLAPLMKISVDDISIKATTNEGLGYVGTENGVNAYAVALIEKAG